MKRLFLLLCAAFCAQAHALTAAEATAIAVGEADARIEAMNKAVATADDRTVAFLQALGDDAASVASLPPSLSYDLWVDGDNRMVRMTMDAMGVATDVTYTDWNDPSITVEAPSADQITDEDPLGLGGTNG